MICSGNLEYGASKKIAALGAAKYAELREHVSSRYRNFMPQDFVAFDPEKNSYEFSREAVMDSEEVEAWTRCEIDVSVKTLRGTTPRTGKDNLVQHVTQISLANIGLLEIQQVTWLEDACTEDLQAHLDDGWRIIAVCPPKDSRRPTYIIGRRDKK